MWVSTMFRDRKIIILLATSVALFQFHRHRPLLYFPIPFLPAGFSSCDSRTIPAIPEPSPHVAEQWLQLQGVFESHPPNLILGREDFQGGQVAQATVSLLANYLDMTFNEARFMRDEHTSVVEALPTYPLGAFSGRGIIILAGGKYSEIAATTLGMTRLVGSRLPVEIWMIDRIEEKEGWCDEMAAQGGMVCRFVSDYMQDMSAFSSHYQLKIAAIMFSSFAEVLYLDADSIPVVNPDSIFDSPTYRDTGAVLWPDYWKATESPFTPYITGQNSTKATCLPDFQTVDSGQMLWNKEKHWKSLCLSAYYNYFGPTYWYTLFTQGGPGWGDKDTFPTALRALRAKWALIPHHLQTQRYDDGTGHGMGTGMAMMQADPADDQNFQPLFLHSNFIKLSVRRLMCDVCIEDPSALSAEQRMKSEEVTFKGAIMERKGNIWNQLNSGTRLFATIEKDGLNDMGRLDTELDMWRVMERVGCTGVFSDNKICRRTRRYLDRTFGMVTRWEGGAERSCS
ncbi:MAG: hypothetical protein Q9178_005326 [Gyalolechia marmorata]